MKIRTAAALAAFFLGFGLAASATGADGFRPLILGGSAVRWVVADQSTVTRLNDGLVLTVGLVQGAASFPGARNCGRMVPITTLLDRSGVTAAAFSKELDAALAMWSEATKVRFQRVDGPADILIGAQADPDGFAFTNVVQGTGASAERIEASTICLNPERSWKIGFDGNLDVFDLRYTLAHELGHALGLDHPSRSGQLMSYRYDEKFRALQPGDRAGIALLYGAHGAASASVATTRDAAGPAGPTVLGIARD